MAPAFMAGLLAGKDFPVSAVFLAIPFAVALLLLGLGSFLRRWRHSGLAFLSGVMMMIVAGGALYSKLWFIPAPDQLSVWNAKEIHLEAEVLSLPKPTKKGWRVEASARSCTLQGDTIQYPVSGKTWIYFPGIPPAELRTHAIIRSEVRVKPVQSDSKSFLRWMTQQGITHNAYSRDQPLLLGEAGGITPHLTHLRESIVRQMMSLMPDRQTGGFAVALMLGDRSGLDQEIKADFGTAGLMHVLAISGMHVCLILVVLDGLIRSLSLSVRMRRLGELLALALLVTYGVLSGASPAVMRAVIMVAMVLGARMMHLRTHALNLLAAAAMLQLLLNPSLLWDAGFELSYAAMFGILAFSNSWQAKLQEVAPWMPDSIAGNVSMTLAAQVATLPLIWYHFGQFPTYFLLSNLATMFVASWAVRIGFFAMVFCFVPGLNALLCGMLDFVLWLLIQACSLIAKLPGATVRSISFQDTGFCISLVVLVTLCVLFLIGRMRKGIEVPRAPTLEELEEG